MADSSQVSGSEDACDRFAALRKRRWLLAIVLGAFGVYASRSSRRGALPRKDDAAQAMDMTYMFHMFHMFHKLHVSLASHVLLIS